MRICMTEPGEAKSSIGAYYIKYWAEQAGYKVDYILPEENQDDWDIELISIHHYTDLIPLANMKQHGKIRILGGHITASNPRPFIRFSDVILRGEGEEWILEALHALRENLNVSVLKGLPGTIICKNYQHGTPISELISSVHLAKLPENPLYLNISTEAGHATNYYIEMARGCPHKCNYCELGHAWPYRPQKKEYLMAQIEQMDKKKTNKVTFFAPDEISHPGYMDCLRRTFERGFTTSFGSMRMDLLTKKDTVFKKNMLIRTAIDGLTEATRKKVNKPITNKQIVDYFRHMINLGYRNFKCFMIFGYPWETLQDFNEWAQVMGAVLSILTTTNIHMRIKFTPLIPNMATPLAEAMPQYDPAMVKKITQWFQQHAKPYRNPGFYVESDGIMSEKNHKLQCMITSGDDDVIHKIKETK